MPAFSDSLTRYVSLFNRINSGNIVIDRWEVFGTTDTETSKIEWEVLVSLNLNGREYTDFITVPRRRCKIFSNTAKGVIHESIT